jgi:hypothetical protein
MYLNLPSDCSIFYILYILKRTTMQIKSAWNIAYETAAKIKKIVFLLTWLRNKFCNHQRPRTAKLLNVPNWIGIEEYKNLINKFKSCFSQQCCNIWSALLAIRRFCMKVLQPAYWLRYPLQVMCLPVYSMKRGWGIGSRLGIKRV